MTISHSGGTQLRSLEKVLEDAQKSGKLNLSGRNLRDYPKSAEKFDLFDTVEIGKLSSDHHVVKCTELCSVVGV